MYRSSNTPWHDENDRSWQKADTIYQTSSGEVWYTPDGEGRIYYDTVDEALEDTHPATPVRKVIA